MEQPVEQKSWVQTLVLLAASLMVFGAMGLFTYGVTELMLLVGVLFFHETGHYLGMRLFNYRDVRMFFIPFFGAAVSGRSTSVAGYKEAIVILLGPVPGILLGAAVGVACLFYDDELLRTTARMLLLINGFNLLPFMPLDGGRLLQLVLFSRQRHLEAIFRFATALLLMFCAWYLESWVLGPSAV
jgi:Zn-dependent protease